MSLQPAVEVHNGKVTGAYTSQAKNVCYGNGSVEDALDELKNTLGRLDWGHVEVISTSTYTPTKPGQLIVSGTTTGSNGYVSLIDNTTNIVVANGYFPSSGTGIGCNALVIVGHTYSSGTYNFTTNRFLFVPFG